MLGGLAPSENPKGCVAAGRLFNTAPVALEMPTPPHVQQGSQIAFIDAAAADGSLRFANRSDSLPLGITVANLGSPRLPGFALVHELPYLS